MMARRTMVQNSGMLLSLGAALGALACGGASSEGQGVMSPEDRIAEQERLAYEAEQEKAKRGDVGAVDVSDEEGNGQFDEKQSKMELTRATRSAKSCVGVVTDVKERGDARVTITFANDGSVSDASITPPFDGNPLGECILNAYKAVIVPPFDGTAHVMDWELKVEDVKE